MDSLFDDLIDEEKNWLPYDGTVNYYGPLFNDNKSHSYYNKLIHTIEWRNDEAVIFGKHIITKRKVAWYGDENYEYTYSNITRKALLWTTLLLEIKKVVELKTGKSYNSCLLNLYHSGEEGMAWHSDDEKDLIQNGSIASLSFGAKRKFALKHKETKFKQIFELGSGDLIEMKGNTQSHWLHNVPTTKKVLKPRINLTFRQMN